MGRFHSLWLMPLLSHVIEAAPATLVHGDAAPLSTATSNAAAVCGMNYDNPADTWQKSGAAQLLSDYLLKNGNTDWANKMDQIYNHPGTGQSTLNCGALSSGLCAFPDPASCQTFQTPAFWHVRNAMAACNNIFDIYHEKLQDNTIIAGLEVDKITKDFGDDPPKKNGLFDILAATCGIAGAGAGYAQQPGIAAVTGIAGAIFGYLASKQEAPDPVNLAPQLKDQVAAVFSAKETTLEKTLSALFNGGLEANNIPGLKPPGMVSVPSALPGEPQEVSKYMVPYSKTPPPVVKFFADGKFLLTPSKFNKAIDSMVQNMSKYMIQALVIQMLKGQNYYVFVNTDRKLSDCAKITGSKWIDNQCFTIEKFVANNNPVQSAEDAPSHSSPLDDDKANKLSSMDYQIDLEQMYRNADACQKAHPDFSGTVSVPSSVLPSGALPDCFFNLAVVKAKFSPCAILKSGGTLPPELGFSTDSCRVWVKPISQPPGGPRSNPLKG